MESSVKNTCPRHEGLAITGKCMKCGAEICSECRSSFGYFCSAECLESSRGNIDHAEKEKRRLEEQSIGRTIRIVKSFLLCAMVVIVIGLGWGTWKFFLDPSGKPVWRFEKSMVSNNFFVVSENEKETIIKTLDELITISSRDGKELGTLKCPALNDYTIHVKTLDGSLITRNKNSVAKFDLKGVRLWERSFGDKEIVHIAAVEKGILVYALKQTVDYEDPKFEPTAEDKMIFLDFDNKVLWEKEFNVYPGICEIASGENILAYVDSTFKDKKYSSHLKTADVLTGDEKWKINMEKTACGSLTIINDTVIFSDGKNLNAVSSDGKTKLWKVKADSYIGGENISFSDGFIFITSYNSLTCISTTENKILWEKKLENPADHKFADGKIYISLSKGIEKEVAPSTEHEVKPPPGFNQLDDDMNPFKKSDKEKGPSKKTVYEPYLACFDAATGNELWRTEKVSGVIVAQSGKLVVIRDTAKENFMDLANMTMIYQLNPGSGKIIFERWGKIPVTAPFNIIGRQLIGVEYEKAQDLITKLTTGNSKFEQYNGIVSFRLR